MNLPPEPPKRGDVRYSAPCPNGHPATWHGSWVRQPNGRDAAEIDVECPVSGCS